MQDSAKKADWDAAALDDFLTGSAPESYEAFCNSFARFKPVSSLPLETQPISTEERHAETLPPIALEPVLYRTAADASMPRMSRIMNFLSQSLELHEEHQDYADYQKEESESGKETDEKLQEREQTDNDSDIGEVLLDEGIHTGQSFEFGAPIAQLDNYVEFDDADLEVEEANFFDPRDAFQFSFSDGSLNPRLPGISKPQISIREIIEMENTQKQERKEALRKDIEANPFVYLEDEVKMIFSNPKASSQHSEQNVSAKRDQASLTLQSPLNTDNAPTIPLVNSSEKEAPIFSGVIPPEETNQPLDKHNDDFDRSHKVESDLNGMFAASNSDITPRQTNHDSEKCFDDTQEGFNPHHQILTDVDHFAENNADGLRFSIAQDELGTCKGKLPAIVNEVMSLRIHTNEDSVSHEPIESFALDPDFDYDNVVLTPKWDPRFHPELFTDRGFKSTSS